jgi:c-di-GMP-binding flagellar brake protein YcgR
LEVQNQSVVSHFPDAVDARRQPRFKVMVDITVHSRTSGSIKGYTVDISESGISAMLKMEVPLGEMLELDFTLPFGPVTIYATARQRNAFRYGFQFLELDAANKVIRSTCRELALNNAGIR